VSTVEAVAVAEWFCRCVDLNPPYVFRSAALFAGRRRGQHTPAYDVCLAVAGPAGNVRIEVDAQSGDVISAYDDFLTRRGVTPTSHASLARTTETWLRRLGRASELKPDPDCVGWVYSLAWKGKRFFNVNGHGRVIFQLAGGRFASYSGVGACPPAPSGQPSVTRIRALSVAEAAQETAMSAGIGRPASLTELGLFYDAQSEKTLWAWQVRQGYVLDGRFQSRLTEYVDGTSGALLTKRVMSSSQENYRSRPKRAGLVAVGGAPPDIPLLGLAERRLNELGRPDAKFVAIDGTHGMQLGSMGAPHLVLSSNGKLYSFSYPGWGVTMDDKSAFEAGRSLILAQRPRLPAGRFLLLRGVFDTFPSVIYRQTALGYDYLNSDVVRVGVAGPNKAATYDAQDPAKLPTAVPPRIFTEAAIEATATLAAKPHLQPSTRGAVRSVKATARALGWFVPGPGLEPVLAYSVSVLFETRTSMGTHGGGPVCHFDAATGRCLDRSFP
jgi:hypothetical protein